VLKKYDEKFKEDMLFNLDTFLGIINMFITEVLEWNESRHAIV